ELGFGGKIPGHGSSPRLLGCPMLREPAAAHRLIVAGFLPRSRRRHKPVPGALEDGLSGPSLETGCRGRRCGARRGHLHHTPARGRVLEPRAAPAARGLLWRVAGDYKERSLQETTIPLGVGVSCRAGEPSECGADAKKGGSSRAARTTILVDPSPPRPRPWTVGGAWDATRAILALAMGILRPWRSECPQRGTISSNRRGGSSPRDGWCRRRSLRGGDTSGPQTLDTHVEDGEAGDRVRGRDQGSRHVVRPIARALM